MRAYLAFLLLLTVLVAAPAAYAGPETLAAQVRVDPAQVTWQPLVSYDHLALRVRGPGELDLRRTFAPGVLPTLDYSSILPDGEYSYELTMLVAEPEASASGQAAPTAEGTAYRPVVQVGTFSIQDAAMVRIAPANGAAAFFDQVIPDDLIVQASICAGFDCVDGENFGVDTIRLKENNLRIHFDDTSTSSGYAANDWRLVANDQASGGANYFAIEDATAGRQVLRVDAGAPANAVYVASTGKVGFRNSNPGLDLHVTTGDTPAFRMEQTNAGGFTAQTWDVGANEANFFVRDLTGGSKLSFRIRPGAPTSSIDIASSGNVGIGTASPKVTLDVAGRVKLEKDYATTDTTFFVFDPGSPSDPLDNVILMQLGGNGNLKISGSLTANGTNYPSSVHLKEHFTPVDVHDVLARLADLPLTTWNYTADEQATLHMGPMAEDFYAAYGLGIDNAHISPLDVNGVTMASIQALYQQLQATQARVETLERQQAELLERMARLEQALQQTAPKQP